MGEMDPRIVMVDQFLRMLAMFGFEAVVWVVVAGVGWVVLQKLRK